MAEHHGFAGLRHLYRNRLLQLWLNLAATSQIHHNGQLHWAQFPCGTHHINHPKQPQYRREAGLIGIQSDKQVSGKQRFELGALSVFLNLGQEGAEAHGFHLLGDFAFATHANAKQIPLQHRYFLVFSAWPSATYPCLLLGHTTTAEDCDTTITPFPAPHVKKITFATLVFRSVSFASIWHRLL